jgi:hypothetical protein
MYAEHEKLFSEVAASARAAPAVLIAHAAAGVGAGHG